AGSVRETRRGDRGRALRRDHLQLRQSRHGRPRRGAVGGDHGGGNGRPRGRPDHRRSARQRRRAAGHRRPRQLRNDARPGHRRAAHLAHRRSRRSGLRRQPQRQPARRRRPARPGPDHPRPARRGQAGGDDRREPAGRQRMTHAARALQTGAALLLAACAAVPAWGQTGSDTQRRLESVRKELREVAADRRRLEGQRGEAARELRAADEQVARSARQLEATEAELERQQAALAGLAASRDALRVTMSAQRAELRALLRASYTAGEAAPLKLLLAQDQVADASRALTYQRYLQRHRAARIAALGEELSGLEALEREIVARQEELERTRAGQRTQFAALERDRDARAQAVTQLEKRYRD